MFYFWTPSMGVVKENQQRARRKIATSRRTIPRLIGSLLILGVALAVCKPTLLAQNKPPAPPNESFKQFLERARARPAPVPSSEDPLADCQRNLKRWTDW